MFNVGMKLNSHKIHLITFSRSRTPLPPHSPLNLCELGLEVSRYFKLLGVKFDNKLTFEKHIHNIVSSISHEIGFIRKCYKNLGNNDAVLKYLHLFCLALSTVLLFGALYLIHI